MLLAVIWDPAGRAFAGAVIRDDVDPVLQNPTGSVSRAAISKLPRAPIPHAGEFLQQVLASGEYVRFFGYDPTYYESGWNWPSSYRGFTGTRTSSICW